MASSPGTREGTATSSQRSNEEPTRYENWRDVKVAQPPYNTGHTGHTQPIHPRHARPDSPLVHTAVMGRTPAVHIASVSWLSVDEN